MSELGIGPGSAMLENFSRIDILPTSHGGGCVVRFNDEQFLSLCLSNSSYSIPWVSSEYDNFVIGNFHLISTILSTNIAPDDVGMFGNTSDRIRLYGGDLHVPAPLYHYIRSFIPQLSTNSIFDDCDRIRLILPIIVIQFEADGNQILFYPEDYPVKVAGTSSCQLLVSDGLDIVGGLFDINPFLLKGVGISIGNCTITSCDLAEF